MKNNNNFNFNIFKEGVKKLNFNDIGVLAKAFGVPEANVNGAIGCVVSCNSLNDFNNIKYGIIKLLSKNSKKELCITNILESLVKSFGCEDTSFVIQALSGRKEAKKLGLIKVLNKVGIHLKKRVSNKFDDLLQKERNSRKQETKTKQETKQENKKQQEPKATKQETTNNVKTEANIVRQPGHEVVKQENSLATVNSNNSVAIGKIEPVKLKVVKQENKQKVVKQETPKQESRSFVQRVMATIQ